MLFTKILNSQVDFEPLRGIISASNQSIYLVGGALRDALLDLPIQDFDFVVEGDVFKLSRRIANAYQGAFYVMDEERATTRVILPTKEGKKRTFDFAKLRGISIEEDLENRDFTINAMALDMRNPGIIIDPLDGRQHLRTKMIVACSETTFSSDPLRILRAIRQAVALQFCIVPETIEQLRKSIPLLPTTSKERQRDEIFRLFRQPEVFPALSLLSHFDILWRLFPQAHENGRDFSSSLQNCRMLSQLFMNFSQNFDRTSVSNLSQTAVIMRWGRFRREIEVYLDGTISPDRSLKGLLYFTTFLLFAGYDYPSDSTQGLIRNDHLFDKENREGILEIGRAFALSNPEIHFIAKALFGISWIEKHFQSKPSLTKRSIHRFFKYCGEAGVGACFIFVAFFLSSRNLSEYHESWIELLELCDRIISVWFDKYEEIIAPPRFLSGNDLQSLLGISPGPMIGKILEELNEAQAEGGVTSKEEAILLAQSLLSGEVPFQDEE